MTDENGTTQVQWTLGNIIPEDIADVLAYEMDTESTNVEEVEEDDVVDNLIDVIFADDDNYTVSGKKTNQ